MPAWNRLCLLALLTASAVGAHADAAEPSGPPTPPELSEPEHQPVPAAGVPLDQSPAPLATEALPERRDRLLREGSNDTRMELLLRWLTEPGVTPDDGAVLGDALAVVRALASRGEELPSLVEPWLQAVFVAQAEPRAQVVAAVQAGRALPQGEQPEDIETIDELPEGDSRAAFLKRAHVREYERRRLILRDPLPSQQATHYFDSFWSVRTGDGIRLGPRRFARLTGDWDRLRRIRGEAALSAVGSGSLAGVGAALLAGAFASQQDGTVGELLGDGATLTEQQAETMATVGGGLLAAALPALGVPLALHGQMHTAYRKPRAQQRIRAYNDGLLEELDLEPVDVRLGVSVGAGGARLVLVATW